MPIGIDQTDGDLLVAAVYWNKSTNAVSVTDTLGLTWKMLPIQDVPTGCGPTGRGTEVSLWYATVTATGANTETAESGLLCTSCGRDVGPPECLPAE